jgi:hypothetical protein
MHFFAVPTVFAFIGIATMAAPLPLQTMDSNSNKQGGQPELAAQKHYGLYTSVT